jgi:hypothetical protein
MRRARLHITVALLIEILVGTVGTIGHGGNAFAAGWTTNVVYEVRALALAGGHVFALSYQTVPAAKLTAQCLDMRTGQHLWNVALDHMRPDVQHVEAVGTAESLYVTTADPVNTSAGYLLSLPPEPGAFMLMKPRPGTTPGVALVGKTLWTTTGGAGTPVRWRSLSPRHTKFITTIGSGGPSGCVGRPVAFGRGLLLPEAGALVYATRTGRTIKRVSIANCTWGDPVPLGGTVAVMSSAGSGAMTVAGVDPVRGVVRWRVQAPPNPARTPYVPTLTGSGGLALATYAHKALVIDAAGRVRHTIDLEGVTRAVAASGGRVVCALKSRRVVRVDLISGTIKDIGAMSEEIGALLVARGRVFAGAGNVVRDLGTL